MITDYWSLLTETMKQNLLLLCALAIIPAFQTHADVLELKNGQVLTGKYAGGTAGTLRFETGSGLQIIETGQSLALTFTGGAAPSAAPAPTPQPAPPPAAAALS